MKKNLKTSAYNLNKWKKGLMIMKISAVLLFAGIVHLSVSAGNIPEQHPVSGELNQKVVKTTDLSETENAQPRRELTGRVEDMKGNSIIGANVYVKNTTIGTITDVRGNFTILVPADAEVLVFSFIGLVTREVPIGATTVFSVVMEDATLEMDEVVVVGYGEQKKASVVGAISTASGEQLKRMNVAEVSNSLTGSIPGLITIQQTSIPGGGDINTMMAGSSGDVDQRTKIYIRGQSTWSGGEPLILVDGVERRMEELDANEISSVSVLKDASATAVFGVRGANGVILITTKRGTMGKPKLTFEGQHTTSVVSKIPKTLNSYDVNNLKNYAIIHELGVRPDAWGNYLPQEILNYYKTGVYPDYFPDTDWPEEMMKNAASSYKFNTNITGGTKFVKYFGSIGYLHEGGILKAEDVGQGYEANYNYDRFNYRSNLDFQFTSTTKVSLNLAGNYGNAVNPGYNDNPIRRMRGIYFMPPDLYPVKYSDGTYANYEVLYPNPYVMTNFKGIDRVTESQMFTDISLEQKLDIITRGLSARASASYDNTLTEDGRAIGGVDMAYKWIDPRIIYAAPEDTASFIHWTIPTRTHGYDYYPDPTQYYEGSQRNLSRRLFYQFSLNYDRDFGKHNITGLALMNRRESAGGSSFVSKREDWVGRVTYNYDSRYFLEVNAGYNGSEKFDRQYRFGFFPSIGGGWMVSNEPFFKEALPWWNTLKFRYSHGMVGSDDGIERWLYIGSWRVTSAQYILGQPLMETGYRVSFEGQVPNPDIHWETAVKRDFGIETGFLNNSLKLSFDYFTDNRRDMLIAANQRTTPVTIGAPLPSGNIGKTKTYGYELDVEYTKYFNSGLNFYSRFATSFVQDKIIYRDDPEFQPAYQKREGYPIDQTHSYADYGIIQNWDEVFTTTLYDNNVNILPGEKRIIDFNGDGVINTKDIVPWGYPGRPEYNYSCIFSLSYRGFSIFTLFYGIFNISYSQNYLPFFPDYTGVAYPHNLRDKWLPELGNTHDAKDRAPRFLSSNVGSSGTYMLIDGSYLRLKNAELSYQVPYKYIVRSGLANLRFYLTGYNILIWTKDNWIEDREAPAGGNTILSYPMMKRFTFGVLLGL